MAESSVDSGFRYVPGFLDRTDADALLDVLLGGIDWRTERIVMFGRAVAVPRLVAWCGDAGVNYRYSGLDHPCTGWVPALLPVRAQLAAQHGMVCALVLLNRYRHGHDGMGWHTDDEPGQGAWIASLSLGAARRFHMRPVAGGPAVTLELAHGSLLLMRGSTPHALPKTRRAQGERVNLSFRQCEKYLHHG